MSHWVFATPWINNTAARQISLCSWISASFPAIRCALLWKMWIRLSIHRRDNVSVWRPKAHSAAHPISMCIITAQAVGAPTLCQRITLGKECLLPQHSGPCSCRGWHCIHPLTQHWRDKSIETAVTVAHHTESQLCFLLQRGAVNIQQDKTVQQSNPTSY